MKSLRLSLVLLALAIVANQLAFGQAVNGMMVGAVSDASGAVVAGAKVTITEVNTQIVHTATTNDRGEYSFPELPPGTYDVMAEMSGFKKEVKSGTVLEANNSPRVDMTLQPGNVTETIEVSGSAVTLQTERADTGRTMDAQMAMELPLSVNNNFQSLLELVPGSAEMTFQHSQFFNAGSTLQTNINGQPRMGNNFQIEGIDNNERTGLLQILITPSEAIQQVSVSTTNHDPELGRGTGAVTNVMIKSGTNAMHGEAYWRDQNSAWDARAFFNPSVGHLAYNQTGGNVGGPIKRNKVFYFVNYLNTQDHEANTNLLTIPDQAFVNGDLSGDTKHVVYDPATGLQDGSGQLRVAFPGNIIPQSRIDPISAKILRTYLPATNMPIADYTTQTNDYFALLPAIKTNNQIDSKVDWSITDKDRLSGRFSFARPTMFQAPIFGDAGGPAQSGWEGSGVQKTYSTGLNYNRIVSPTLLTEVRIGVAHYHNEAYQSDHGKKTSENLGIPGVNLSDFTSGMVGINIGGFSTPTFGYNAGFPWDRAEANIDMVNNWTKLWKNHQTKWGVDIRRIRDDLLQDQTYSPRGIIYFGTGQTAKQTCSATTGTCSNSSNGIANDMASFLLDVPYQEARDVNTYFPAFRQWQISSYVADNWQVTPRLTVTLGLRWEIYTAPTPRFAGGFSNYDPSDNTLKIAGIGNNPMNLGFKTDMKNFAPRIGLAYRLTDKTVVRAGFGTSFTPFPDNTWMYNYPVRANNMYAQPGGSTDTNGPVILPKGKPGSFENGFPLPVPIQVPSNGIITNPDPTTEEFYIPTNYKTGYIEAWNAAIQRQLPFGFLLDLAYVGSHAVDTPAKPNINAGQIIGAGANGEIYFKKYGQTAPITMAFAAFSSSYNSLQVKFDRRLAKGLNVTTAFTWQKAMDFQQGDDGALSFYAGQGLRRNYARADFDRTLNYVQSYIYQLPFGAHQRWLSHGWAGKVIGGWQVSGILSARTGKPMTFTGSNSLNLGTGGTATDNQVGPVQILGGIGTGDPWFTTASFAKAPTNVQGNSGRNIMSGPNLYSLNASLSRHIDLRSDGHTYMQLRIDSLNVTNTPQFSNPNTSSIGTANFGIISSTISSGTGVNGTGGGRNVTISVKVFF